MRNVRVMSAAIVAALAGQAHAQPVIDGTRAGDESFYTQIWVQNTPTEFGDNTPGDPCDPSDVGMPADVDTGMEICIPLTAFNFTLAPGGTFKLAGFINSGNHGFLSNQVIGGLGFQRHNQNLGEPRNVDFGAIGSPDDPDDQFVEITLPGTSGTTAIVVDGVRDAAYTNVFTQTCRTGFGDNTTEMTDPNFGERANGSEIDNVGWYLSDAGTPGDPLDDLLYIFIGGNLESNFNNLDLFFDTTGGGQNTIAEGVANPDIDNGALQRMGTETDDPPTDPPGGPMGPGLTFDAGFAFDFFFSMRNGDTDSDMDPETVDIDIFANWAEAGGAGFFLGQSKPLSDGTFFDDADTMTNPNPSGLGIAATIDNSNLAGVPGSCPPPAGDRDSANGSEIDSVWAYVDTTTRGASTNSVYLLITGNLQSNFNKLALFFDVDPMAGQNPIITGDNAALQRNPDIDFGALGRMGAGGGGSMNPGLTFDSGFTADYFLNLGNGNGGQSIFSNSAVLRTNGMLLGFNDNPLDYGMFDGGDKATEGDPIPYDGPNIDCPVGTETNTLNGNFAPRLNSALIQPPNMLPATCDPNPLPGMAITGLIEIALDNSNIGGVGAFPDGDVSDAGNVQTGIEIRINLDELGYSSALGGGGTIKLAGFICDGGHSFVSNQVIGGLPAGFGPCPGDIATTGGAACMGGAGGSFGTPDLNVDLSDLLCFVNVWNTDLGTPSPFPGSAADVTTTGTAMGSPNFGVPDGNVDLADLLFFVNEWNIGLSECVPGMGAPTAPSGNLGEPTVIDFSQIDGVQYIEIPVP